ncbi:hypothetical protein GIX77_09805 [Lactobacillus reuteri]|uniref:DUF536 domain-containing protein n=1 Tax=Limosilactobacillus reuteri TaxID=1598 RepID=A0A7X2KJR7_LIMRT|nr:hypothetical protein [Limosilactobacillus reuteri]MRH81050.1 hypothetical protein [Limosilactobacillus reuteri]
MPEKRYTIKQLADELGVTKPGVRKLMTANFRKQYTETVGNRILINSAGAKVIRKHFSNNGDNVFPETKTETNSNKQKQAETVSDSTKNAVVSAQEETIKLLKEELKAKNDQLANMQKLMDQNQQLLLNTQAENKTLLALTHKNNDESVTEAEYKETDQAPQHPKHKSASQSKSDQDIINKLNKKKKWWKLW